MKYIPLIVMTLILIMLIYFGKKNNLNKEESEIQTIKRSVITTIFINSLIITPFILFKMKGDYFDLMFFWFINFIVPYFGFKKLFK